MNFPTGSMEPFPILRTLLTIAVLATVSSSAMAQSSDQQLPSPQPAKVRKAAPRPMPFPPGSENAESTAPVIKFLSYDRMSEEDRDLVADAESTIGERAGFAGLEFNQGKWSYQQIVCSALPHHLLLQFTRNNGKGDVSVFSASIPRGGEGRVRIVPILRRGYSLFSPAPINALTISAFNHIRAEEAVVQTPQWLETGLCYAAMAGAHPQVGSPEETEIKKLPAAPPGRLTIPMHGGAVIEFTDAAAIPRPMQWTMTFNGRGKLLKATHSAAARMRDKVVERKPVEVQGKAVQAASAEGKATLIR
ncbi:MAG: hypothetical protein WCA21_20710 [Terracidiphilus sp.]